MSSAILLFLHIFVYYKVNKWMQVQIQSDPHQAQHQRERQTNTIKQPQNEQKASRFGNPFQKKKWQLCYLNLTEYI